MQINELIVKTWLNAFHRSCICIGKKFTRESPDTPPEDTTGQPAWLFLHLFLHISLQFFGSALVAGQAMHQIQSTCLFRFNKICHPSQRPRWQVDKEAIGLSRVQQCSSTYKPALLRYVSTLFLNIFMLLAVTQSVDNLFHSFIVLCEKECFLMSNLH